MKIAFIYSGGREARWESTLKGESPKDFFYGAAEIAQMGDAVGVIDVPPANSHLLTGIVDRLGGCLFPARTNTASMMQVIKILPRLKGYDCVVATYAQAALVLGFMRRWKLFSLPLIGIQCGLVNYRIGKLRTRATSLALAEAKSILFADTEQEEMQCRYGLSSHQIVSGDFGVDMDYWTPDHSVKKEDFVLSVGNDGRRDYATLIEAAKEVTNEVRIVTRRTLPDNLPSNVRPIRGDWQGQLLSDADLRDMYRRARKVIIPLTESPQPSGQSVAMQALACGTPVIMTRTEGCWVKDVLHAPDMTLVPPKDPIALARAMQEKVAFSEQIQGRKRLLEVGWDGKGFARRLREVCTEVAG